MTWQPKPNQIKPGESVIAAYSRKMEAIAMRRLLRQSGTIAELRKLEGETEPRWCLIVREKDAK